MDYEGDDENERARVQPDLATHGSGLVEQVLEYQFLAALTPELLRRGLGFEVLRGDFDLDGHDVVIEAGGITRHIQLKAMVLGGRTRHVPINTRLAAKPSGCVVWMTYDPASLTVTGWRWFGAAAGNPLPDLGNRVARHSRANSEGVKAERPHIRILPANRFEAVETIADLANRLFGPRDLMSLRAHLGARTDEVDSWLSLVREGLFRAIPSSLDWESSGDLAMLVDGYELAADLGLGDPMAFEERQLRTAMDTGHWPGSPAQLWVTLFLEHRRWRFSSPFEPDREMRALLDRLVQQLRAGLLA